ncbi:heme exporter protein CcmD [Hydrogenophaga sp.]|jgi:heme exporter protein D|uniref:heme exporter protein CcmD n=1 Tax=Hydrogenophaga sp. TaxID=1904254 RepID=UPI00273228E6|nr:heme exporter protein CcmD [Hydrogenophaga sp.]MDP1688136.1 heme exporter protein CcmD [Hydrogenophaga sp.]
MSSLGEFVAMGGYGLYVWGSLGMCAAVVVAELSVIRLRRRLLAQEVGDERATEEPIA